jgi:hypothetical protein
LRRFSGLSSPIEPRSDLRGVERRLRAGAIQPGLQAYERERQRREREEAKEEASRQKQRERRQHAVDKAQAALDKAEQEHTRRAAALRSEIETIEEKLNAEEAKWDKEKQRLKAASRRAAD